MVHFPNPMTARVSPLGSHTNLQPRQSFMGSSSFAEGEHRLRKRVKSRRTNDADTMLDLQSARFMEHGITLGMSKAKKEKEKKTKEEVRRRLRALQRTERALTRRFLAETGARALHSVRAGKIHLQGMLVLLSQTVTGGGRSPTVSSKELLDDLLSLILQLPALRLPGATAGTLKRTTSSLRSRSWAQVRRCSLTLL